MRRLQFDPRRWARVRPARRASGVHVRLRHGLATGDVFVDRDEYQTSAGVKIIHAQHYHRGLKVFRSSQVVKIRNGRARRTPPLFRVPVGLKLAPVARPLEAVAALLTFLQRRGLAPTTVRLSLLRETSFRYLVDAPTVIELRYGFSAPVRMHLEILPQPAGRAALAWVGDAPLRRGRKVHFAVSAGAGRPRILFAAQTNTCAFDADWIPFPDIPERRTFPIPPFATTRGGSGRASQWQAGARAGGPNVTCHVGDAPKVEPLGTLSVDNAFVWCNHLHDFFAEFGFDSAHHAFEGDDPLWVARLSEENPAAAQFDNLVDGGSPVLLLYSNAAGPTRHAATDSSILIHEYTHGVSSRLVGGAECDVPFVGTQALGFSEGMSDYFALTVLNFIDRSRGGPGALTVFGGRFRPGGLRDYAGFRGRFVARETVPHRVGMVWCAGLLDARAAILAASGDADLTDRFLWQASVDTFKAMAPLCKQTLSLTLAHAKDALTTEAGRLETSWGLRGAADEVARALAARGI